MRAYERLVVEMFGKIRAPPLFVRKRWLQPDRLVSNGREQNHN
jgi:hypothetical protein